MHERTAMSRNFPSSALRPCAVPAIYAEKGIATIALSQNAVSDAISGAIGVAVNMVPSDVEVTLKEENEPRTYKIVSTHASTPHLR